MKRNHPILIVLCLFAGLNYTKAQNTLLVAPAKIDSLQNLIDAHPKDDKEKVRLLNEFARLCFYNQEYKEGLIATREARELSQKLEFEGGLIMYYVTLETFTAGGSNFDEYQLIEAKNIAFQTGDWVFAQKPTYPNGYPYNISKDILGKLQPSLDYFTALDDKEIHAAILIQYAIFYYSNNQLDKFDKLMDQLITFYKDINRIDLLSLVYMYKLDVAQKLNHQTGIDSIIHELDNVINLFKNEPETGWTDYQIANINFNIKQYAEAIVYYNKSADFFVKKGDINSLLEVYNKITEIYTDLEMFSNQAAVLDRMIQLLHKTTDKGNTYQEPQRLYNIYQTAVWANYNSKKYDKAREYIDLLLKNRHNIKDSLNLSLTFITAQKDQLEAQILMGEEKYDEAIPLLIKAYSGYTSYSSVFNRNTGPWAIAHLSNCYYQKEEYQTALKYAILCINTARPTDVRLNTKITLLLANIYEALRQKDQAYVYLRKHQDLVDEIKNVENTKQIFKTEMNSVVDKSNEQINRLEQESLLKEQKNKNQRLWIFSITGALLSSLLIAFILYRHNKNRQKANTVLQQTLSNLKSTQSQLIQSEKMASLGELTAGIAHEIQNPLNFVNNFSDLNKELVGEANEELDKGNTSEAKLILNDIKENEEKINHHGKRAESIVKGMLLHSRGSSGQKEPTDINALCDEYLRLSYHGFRAKDKSFNADFKLEADKKLPKINVVPQDIGRVLLNLVNNAFFAVNEKVKENGNSFEPLVVISTSVIENNVKITVSDNGNGIPDSAKNKIFQPFFTTKPTGQGTGLGLSLSYDIIKAHGGELNAISNKDEGTEFIIKIPVN